MAVIKISELSPAGSELFQDSESFLNDLSEREVGAIEGARGFVFSAGVSAAISITAQVNSVNANSNNANTLGNLNTVAVG